MLSSARTCSSGQLSLHSMGERACSSSPPLLATQRPIFRGSGLAGGQLHRTPAGRWTCSFPPVQCSIGPSCSVSRCRIAQQEREALEQEAAATSGRISSEEDLRKAAAKGSPYTAPGGRWASFRSYSVWQRSFMIWGFALRFFFKLWLVGKKFTYGKKV